MRVIVHVKRMSTAVLPTPQIEITPEDSNKKSSNDEDDDFEKELDSFIESEEKSDDERQPVRTAETTQVAVTPVSDISPEKGTWEIESGKKEDSVTKVTETHSDSEPEADDYEFTEDQKRAMMEYKLQREEDGFPDEDPPEYDVKDKLIKYNAELAQDETPLESKRETKVVFKEELVDLVAPAPDFPSDDDQTPREKTYSADKVKSDDDEDESSSKSSGSELGKHSKQVVLERDGQFSYVNVQDLTASERRLHNIESPTEEKDKETHVKSEKNTNNSYDDFRSKHPTPPSHARPATANGNSRRKTRPATAPQRPKSAVTQSTALQNFNYNSPYAMSPSEKEAAARRMKYLEEKKKHNEEKKKKEEEESKTMSESAFFAWKREKQKHIRKQKEEEMERRKKEETPDREKDDTIYSESSDAAQTEQSREAYNEWLKNKRTQMHKEKLLKKREEQEMKERFYLASREECDKAFREWLKKKNIESRKACASEKHRNKTHKATIRRSRKTMALMRAIRQAQSFKYVDYYGYRY